MSTNRGTNRSGGFQNHLGEFFLELAITGEPRHFELSLSGQFDGNAFDEPVRVCQRECSKQAFRDRRGAMEGGVELIAGSVDQREVCAGHYEAEQLGAFTMSAIGELQSLDGIPQVRSVDLFPFGHRLEENVEICGLRSERRLRHRLADRRTGIEELQNTPAFLTVRLPTAVAEILFALANDLRAEERIDYLGLARTALAEQDQPWGMLEQEKCFDRRNLLKDRLLQSLREPVHERLELIVDGEKFHDRNARGSLDLTADSEAGAPLGGKIG